MIYFNWPPGPFLATQYDKEPGGAEFEVASNQALPRARYFPRDMLLLTTTARESRRLASNQAQPLLIW